MEFGQRSVRLPKTPQERLQWRRVVVILEHCPIQQIQDRNGNFGLLREKHRIYHAKHKTDPAQWRPDVVHQCLLHLMDSPLNRSGRLQVFLRTTNGILIMVDPRLHVPRSMRLFEAMMARLLFKLKIRSTVNQLQLLRVVKNPVTDHLPENTKYIRVERGGSLEDPVKFCTDLANNCGGVDPTSARGNNRFGDAGSAKDTKNYDDDDDNNNDSDDDEEEESDIPIWEREEGKYKERGGDKNNMRPFAFVIGGMSKGDVEVDYITDADKETSTVSFSTRPMSAAAICSMVCHAFEMAWMSHDYSHSTNTFTPV